MRAEWISASSHRCSAQATSPSQVRSTAGGEPAWMMMVMMMTTTTKSKLICDAIADPQTTPAGGGRESGRVAVLSGSSHIHIHCTDLACSICSSRGERRSRLYLVAFLLTLLEPKTEDTKDRRHQRICPEAKPGKAQKGEVEEKADAPWFDMACTEKCNLIFLMNIFDKKLASDRLLW
ncbi:unnamed protein product [Calypogeia fissa]